MQELLQTLTLDQARKWDAVTDKFVFIDDDILEPAGLRANDARVAQVENALAQLLTNNTQTN